jgi:hypothetical protein
MFRNGGQMYEILLSVMIPILAAGVLCNAVLVWSLATNRNSCWIVPWLAFQEYILRFIV